MNRRSFLKRASGIIVGSVCAIYIPSNHLEFGVPRVLAIPNQTIPSDVQRLIISRAAEMVKDYGFAMRSGLDMSLGGPNPDKWIPFEQYVNPPKSRMTAMVTQRGLVVHKYVWKEDA